MLWRCKVSKAIRHAENAMAIAIPVAQPLKYVITLKISRTQVSSINASYKPNQSQPTRGWTQPMSICGPRTAGDYTPDACCEKPLANGAKNTYWIGRKKTPRQQSSTREDASNYTGDTRCKQGQWTNDWLHHICLELGVNRSPQAVCRTWLLRLQQLDLNNENASKYPGIHRWFAEISRCNDNKSQDICANESLKRIAESRYLRVFILRSAHLLTLNVLSIVLSIVYTC